MASFDHGASGVDDPPGNGHATPVIAAPAPFALPLMGNGYAPDPRNKAYALTIVATLHVAAFVAFMLHRSPDIMVPSPPQPLVVTLLPLARPPAEVRAKDVPPRPTPKTPAAVHAALTSPVPRPIVPIVVAPAVLPTAPVPPASVAPPAPPTQTTVARPAPVADPPGNARDSWEGRVLARLERFKRYPAAAQSRRDQGVATIRFRLDRQGRVLSSSVARSSGNATLDQEALATLARAQPLPPIPADRPDEVELMVPVEFFLTRL
jgi:protein TonB